MCRPFYCLNGHSFIICQTCQVGLVGSEVAGQIRKHRITRYKEYAGPLPAEAWLSKPRPRGAVASGEGPRSPEVCHGVHLYRASVDARRVLVRVGSRQRKVGSVIQIEAHPFIICNLHTTGLLAREIPGHIQKRHRQKLTPSPERCEHKVRVITTIFRTATIQIMATRPSWGRGLGLCSEFVTSADGGLPGRYCFCLPKARQASRTRQRCVSGLAVLARRRAAIVGEAKRAMTFARAHRRGDCFPWPSAALWHLARAALVLFAKVHAIKATVLERCGDLGTSPAGYRERMAR